MANIRAQTTFSEAFPEVARSQQRRFLVLFSFTILILALLNQSAVTTVQVPLSLFIIFSSACFVLYFLFVSPHKGQIIGKENVLTVLGKRHVLKPGDSIRLWYPPRRVETIPLVGMHTADFVVPSLGQFHALEHFLPGFDLSQGENRLEVSVQCSWRILCKEQMDSRYFHTLAVFHSSIVAHMKGKVVESLQLLSQDPTAHSASLSTAVESVLAQHVNECGAFGEYCLPYHLEVKSLSIKLVATTTTQVPV